MTQAIEKAESTTQETPTVVVTNRPPIIPELDYVFQAAGAVAVEVRQCADCSFAAVNHSSGIFVLPDLTTAELKPGIATFVCSAEGKQDWAFNVTVVAGLPEEF